MTTLTDKYKIKSYSDIKGQEFAIEKIKYFIKNFPRRKALLLHGPAGTGKTSLAYATAFETKAEIFEMNASDFRNKDNIQKIIGEAAQQTSLFNKNKIILVDEADGITTEDRGGLPELVRLIDKTSFPIIITANDIWDKKFSDLRKSCDMVELKELDYKIIFQLIREISKKENLDISEDTLKSIAIKSKGDMRAAINDLQSVSINTAHEDIGERDKEENIFDTLKQVLRYMPNKETPNLYDKVNMSLDDIFLWVEENVPLEYKGEEIYKAFDALSKADVFRGRIYRQQHWRFLVYQNFFLSAGVASAKDSSKNLFVNYKRPSRILKIWLINQKQQYMKSISEKYAKFAHIGLKRAKHEFPILRNILKNDKIRQELKLDEKEIEFLDKPVI